MRENYPFTAEDRREAAGEYLPTPSEIAAATAKIRAKWTADEEKARRVTRDFDYYNQRSA